MKLVFGEGSCGIAAGARKVRAAVEKLIAEDLNAPAARSTSGTGGSPVPAV